MPTVLASTTKRRMPRARNMVSCTGPCGSTPARVSGAGAAGLIASGGLRVRTRRGLLRLVSLVRLLGLLSLLRLLGLLELGRLLGLLLGDGGVAVDVLLAGEPHDLVHDLVG